MNPIRSPYELMQGWMHLPRYVDKIRLYLAGKLDPAYEPNLGKNTDALWLTAAGLTHEQMLDAVRGTLTDGEVCEWVRQNVHKSDADKHSYNHHLVNRPDPHDPAQVQHFTDRKAAYGLSERHDITRFLDLIEADEGRI